jgi:hypothetical protein
MCRARSAAHTMQYACAGRLATDISKPSSGQDAVKILAKLAPARLQTQPHSNAVGPSSGKYTRTGGLPIPITARETSCIAVRTVCSGPHDW